MTVNPPVAPPPSGTGSVLPASRAEATRQRVLDAALEVFCEQTYGGARIEQIAERAGVAMGTIYKHFASKQALVNELFRYWKAKTSEYTYPHSPGVSARERYHAWFQQVCRFAVDYPFAHEFLVTHHHGPYLDAESLAVSDPMDRLSIRNIEDGQAEGAVRPGDPAVLSAMVVGILLGLTREMRARGATLDTGTLALAEACGWDMLRAR
jgi:TetR/AcrR family transcriptional regulator, repressor of fatR-cypB operon